VVEDEKAGGKEGQEEEEQQQFARESPLLLRSRWCPRHELAIVALTNLSPSPHDWLRAIEAVADEGKCLGGESGRPLMAVRTVSSARSSLLPMNTSKERQGQRRSQRRSPAAVRTVTCWRAIEAAADECNHVLEGGRSPAAVRTVTYWRAKNVITHKEGKVAKLGRSEI